MDARERAARMAHKISDANGIDGKSSEGQPVINIVPARARTNESRREDSARRAPKRRTVSDRRCKDPLPWRDAILTRRNANETSLAREARTNEGKVLWMSEDVTRLVVKPKTSPFV
ncbi:hypothetical protein HN011_012090 [Eciton burchellii]|nr:hypothetical protein HN011_012090 [Eciton burchellii]